MGLLGHAFKPATVEGCLGYHEDQVRPPSQVRGPLWFTELWFRRNQPAVPAASAGDPMSGTHVADRPH